MKKSKLIIFAVFAALFVLSCKNYTLPPTVVPVSEISVNSNQTDVSLAIGSSYQLQAKVLPENATDKKITYTSHNPAVASVNEEGVITALSAGSAKITITASNDISKEINVTVTAVSVTDIVFDPALPGNPLLLSVGVNCPIMQKYSLKMQRIKILPTVQIMKRLQL